MPEKRGKRDRAIIRRRYGEDTGHVELMTGAIEIQKLSRFAGPISPPTILSDYEVVLPGLAGRIVEMSEGEARHRRRIQGRQMRLAEAGLISAFVIAMTVIVGGFYLIHEGATREGIGSILAALTTLLIVYLTRGRKVVDVEKKSEDG